MSGQDYLPESVKEYRLNDIGYDQFYFLAKTMIYGDGIEKDVLIARMWARLVDINEHNASLPEEPVSPFEDGKPAPKNCKSRFGDVNNFHGNEAGTPYLEGCSNVMDETEIMETNDPDLLQRVAEDFKYKLSWRGQLDAIAEKMRQLIKRR